MLLMHSCRQARLCRMLDELQSRDKRVCSLAVPLVAGGSASAKPRCFSPHLPFIVVNAFLGGLLSVQRRPTAPLASPRNRRCYVVRMRRLPWLRAVRERSQPAAACDSGRGK
ncbi:hypothetical protein LZ32DRAFT_443930 [Colletotrichum eremochloae]|nr:hypothetical protein LZ32DRAFT_443930 [Colletotrichum eremochloae]